MSNHKVYRIKLTSEERETLTQVAKGNRGQLKISVWKVQRANAMLMCDESEDGPAWSDESIAKAFGTTTRSMGNWRKQAALQGPLSLLERKEREHRRLLRFWMVTRKLASRKLHAPRRQTDALAGHCRCLRMNWLLSKSWTPFLQIRWDVSKKNELKPRLKSMWCIPPE